MTTRKTTSSRLFQGRPNQLLLDERVSKIALPKLDANRVVMDESDIQFETEALDLDETEVTEKLQIFVGVGASDSSIDHENEWLISEDDDPFFDGEDFSEDEGLDAVPVPMALNLTASIQEVSDTPSSTAVQQPILQPIQEVQAHEAAPLLDLPEDDWSQINWEDVTLSDILGDVDDVGEDTAGAQLNLDDDVPVTDMTTEEVFPALVSLEDAPTWEMAWDDDPDSAEDTAGAQVSMEDEWFSEGAGIASQSAVLHVESKLTGQATYTTNRPPPPRIVLKQPKSLWDDRLVQVWLMLLGVAFVAALGWRILNAQ